MPAAAVKAKVSGAFIRSVNPRLVDYSKPLLIAGLVTIGTLALTGALFAVQITQCPTEVAVELDTFFGSMDEQKDTYRRKKELAGTQAGTTTTVTVCLKTSNELAVVGHPNYVDTLTSPGVVQYNPCSLDAAAMAELHMSDCVYDAGSNTVTNAQACASTALACRPCGDALGDGTRAATGALQLPSSPFVTSVETVISTTRCPAVGTALGAALGYATYIELVLTILIVAGLKACKLVEEVGGGGGVGSLVASGLGVSQKEFEEMRSQMAVLQAQLKEQQPQNVPENV